MDDLAGNEPRPLDKGAYVALGVLLLLMVGYQVFVYGPQYEDWKKKKERFDVAAAAQETAAVDSGTVAEVDTTTLAQAEPGADQPEAPPPVANGDPAPHDDAIAFETPAHTVRLSTAGASLQELTFKEIYETTYAPEQSRAMDLRKPAPFRPLHPYQQRELALAVRPLDPALGDVATRDWHHEALPGGAHEFSTTLANGLRLVKTYRPPVTAPEGAEPERLFHFDVELRIENTTGAPQRFGYLLNGPAGMVEQESGRYSYGLQHVIATREGDEVEAEVDAVRSLKKVGEPEAQTSGDVGYFGLASKYFTAVVIPTGETKLAGADVEKLKVETPSHAGAAKEGEEFETDQAQAVVRGRVAELTIAPGDVVTQTFMAYVGPRQEGGIFDQPTYAPYGLRKLVYYGWFDGMARLMTWILSGLYAVFGNWGVAILTVTLMVRGLLMPLSMWSQRNMFRMQKLTPEMNKLKEKFTGKDGEMTREQQQAFQAAQMELFRTHKVNPVGCLGPIFLQMPIFIGLYNALAYSSALRHSSFAFWITDLSQPDVLFRLPITLPLLGTNAFSVLPLLVVVTYIIQQNLQPKPSDPKQAEQQKIMKFMLPLMGFLFYTAPSGFMLYFIATSTWGIAEQKIIKKRLEEDEGKPHASGGKKKDKAKAK